MKRSVAVAAALSLSVGGGALAVTAANGDDPVGVYAPPIASVSTSTSEAFSLFRQADARADDAMPSDAVEQVATSQRYGRNADLARGVRTANGRGWAVPGADTLCLVVKDPVDGYGTTCRPQQEAARFGVVLIMVAPDDPSVARVSAVLPDGARAEAVGAGKAQTLAPDAEGAVAAVVPTGSTIEVTSPDGAKNKFAIPSEFPTSASPQG